MNAAKKKRALRRKFRMAALRQLIEDIENLKFDNTPISMNDKYPIWEGSRKEYQSPLDRSSYNYGYMLSSELGAGQPNEWN